MEESTRKAEQARLAQLEKAKQDSTKRLQDSIANARAKQKEDSLAKILEAQKLQKALQDKKTKDSLDFITNIKWQDLEYFRAKGKYGFRDKNTKKIIVPAQYDTLWAFQDGFARVKEDGLYGFIDKTGKKVTELKYDYVMDFSEGLAGVKKNRQWGFIDTTSEEVIKLQYDDIIFFIFSRRYYIFKNGKAKVRKNGKYFYINKQGKCVEDCP